MKLISHVQQERPLNTGSGKETQPKKPRFSSCETPKWPNRHKLKGEGFLGCLMSSVVTGQGFRSYTLSTFNSEFTPEELQRAPIGSRIVFLSHHFSVALLNFGGVYHGSFSMPSCVASSTVFCRELVKGQAASIALDRIVKTPGYFKLQLLCFWALNHGPLNFPKKNKGALMGVYCHSRLVLTLGPQNHEK